MEAEEEVLGIFYPVSNRRPSRGKACLDSC